MLTFAHQKQGRVMRRLSVQFDALSFEGTCELWDSARKWVDQQMNVFNAAPGGTEDMDMDMETDMDIEDEDDDSDNNNNNKEPGEASRTGFAIPAVNTKERERESAPSLISFSFPLH